MPVYTVKAHKEILNSIDGVGGLAIGDGAPEIVTGSRDGKSINSSVQLKPFQCNGIKEITYIKKFAEMSHSLLHYRDSKGVGSQTEGFTCSQHGANGRRN